MSGPVDDGDATRKIFSGSLVSLISSILFFGSLAACVLLARYFPGAQDNASSNVHITAAFCSAFVFLLVSVSSGLDTTLKILKFRREHAGDGERAGRVRIPFFLVIPSYVVTLTFFGSIVVWLHSHLW